MDRARWNEYQEWLTHYIKAFDHAFRNRIRNLKDLDMNEEDTDLM